MPLEARPVVGGGGVVDPDGRAAGPIGLPGWDAGHDAAHDRTEAGDVLVALPVAEAGAPRLAVAARAARAAARRARARAAADAAGAAPARPARGVAVDVVPGAAAAEARAVDLPPPARVGAGGAAVHARGRAAELGVPVAARGAAVAGRAAAVAHGRVGGAGLEGVGPRHGRQGGAGHRAAGEEAAPAHAGGEGPRRPFGEALGHVDPRRTQIGIGRGPYRLVPSRKVTIGTDPTTGGGGGGGRESNPPPRRCRGQPL